MKALSVRQPWASMISSGEKSIEVRSWSTTYRGPLLICVSKSPQIRDLPTGVALCVVQLIDVRPITHDDSTAACCDVDPAREFAWVLSDPQPLEFLSSVKGRLGLFDAPAEFAAMTN